LEIVVGPQFPSFDLQRNSSQPNTASMGSLYYNSGKASYRMLSYVYYTETNKNS